MMDFASKSLKPNYYELLEVSMGADEEEIRRAYDRTKQIYAEDALAVYGLYAPDELREYREQVERAFRVLIDNDNRRAYDRTLITKPLPKSKRILVRAKSETNDENAVEAKESVKPGKEGEDNALREWLNEAEAVAADDPNLSFEEAIEAELPAQAEPAENATPKRKAHASRRVELPEGAPITGPTLRALREEAGIELREISEETKVSTSNLRMIEDEEWDKLPAWVYVRGFIILYARYLKIDGKLLLNAFKPRHAEAHIEE